MTDTRSAPVAGGAMLKVGLDHEAGLARSQGLALVAGLGCRHQDAVRIATMVSELARYVTQDAGGAWSQFTVPGGSAST